MRRNIAFTMSEAMIVLGIVAVLAALSLVAVNGAKPDENIIMFRRAYGTTLKVIQNLMNDKQLYPNATVVAYNNGKSDVKSLLSPNFSQLVGLITSKYDLDKICNEMDDDCEDNIATSFVLITSSSTSSSLATSVGLISSSFVGTTSSSANLSTNGMEPSLTSGGTSSGTSSSSSSTSSSSGGASWSNPCNASSGADDDVCDIDENGYYFCNSDCSYECVVGANSYYDGSGHLVCVEPCSSGKVWNSDTLSCQLPLTTSSGTTSGGLPSVSSKAIITTSLGSVSSLGVTTGVLATSGSSSYAGDSVYDKSYNFDSLVTSVFGKGFSDTEITADMKTKYPYLASATTSNKFAYSFLSRLNPIESSISGNTAKFTTPDGIYWEVVDNFSNSSNPHAMITVLLNGSSAKSCYYESNNCAAPNKFTFHVDKSGRVYHKLGNSTASAADPMACSYARYSSVTKNSKIPTNASVNTCFGGGN